LSHNETDHYTSGGFKIAIYDPPNARPQWFEVMRRQDNFDYVGPAVLRKNSSTIAMHVSNSRA
jgi:hypothetical protein